MHLSPQHILQLTQHAVEAAQKAGELIRSYTRKQVTVQNKQAGSSHASQIVTEVDLKSEALILKTLQPSIEEFDLALLAEETYDDYSRHEKDYFWCIDPLDGTLPFTEGKPGYAISIALIAKDGTPHIGVVYDPVNHNLYYACTGGGAFRNNQPWNPLSSQKIKSRNTLTTTVTRSEVEGQTAHPDKAAATQLHRTTPLHFYYNRSFTTLAIFKQVLQQLESIAYELGYSGLTQPGNGGAVMNALWALENTPSCYFAFPKKQEGGGSIWDYAATACIYKEVGAWVSDIYGKPLHLNSVGSSFMNESGILYASDRLLAQKICNLYNQ